MFVNAYHYAFSRNHFRSITVFYICRHSGTIKWEKYEKKIISIHSLIRLRIKWNQVEYLEYIFHLCSQVYSLDRHPQWCDSDSPDSSVDMVENSCLRSSLLWDNLYKIYILIAQEWNTWKWHTEKTIVYQRNAKIDSDFR